VRFDAVYGEGRALSGDDAVAYARRGRGERLFVSAGTVQTHLTRIYTKLDVTRRTELAARAASRP